MCFSKTCQAVLWDFVQVGQFTKPLFCLFVVTGCGFYLRIETPEKRTTLSVRLDHGPVFVAPLVNTFEP
jgi:hypothetical protein